MSGAGWAASRILPALAPQFGVTEPDLWLTDAFVVKYELAGQAGLGAHVDDSEISFTVLLSPVGGFDGGGTHFEALRQLVESGVKLLNCHTATLPTLPHYHTRNRPSASWLRVAPSLFEDTTPSPTPAYLVAFAAPA